MRRRRTMSEYTPDTLRVAFEGETAEMLPPGSMTLEPTEEVAKDFADAWEAQLASLRRENEALEKALKEIASGDWNEDGMCEVAIRALAARGGGEGR
jgi:hypothetical protein